ncbi:MAG: hypothetical protein DRP91_07290 [Candidatus Neomarinimicrobiota bacterium]|nr:VanZ family protein [Candidatus Neomarinimicrobiota bacterium]MCD6100430.1 VanZ family protein [Candidatus Neomarinimicrobiota bacterium]RKY47633.1 MAG: hypothetical protein DRP91_07290 [Candidatus Neomarinimicrobiota bacterium]RKY51534.1 MAG: hypothetical protein DRP92_07015 [Candidatus Neomarinimicrobiota bacterium]HDN59930.1 VanZ family protein [Candidatus Neomarinimicrobiota bacterium]
MRKRLAQLPVFVYTVAIFVGSSLPIGGQFNVLGKDKILHAIEFGLYAIAMNVAIVYSGNTKYVQGDIFYTILFSMFYAAFDEIHQGFVPLRDCSVYDFTADVIGIVIFITIYKLFNKMVKSRYVPIKIKNK